MGDTMWDRNKMWVDVDTAMTRQCVICSYRLLLGLGRHRNMTANRMYRKMSFHAVIGR